MQSVNDSVAATTAEDWDAEDTQFQYDANGNVILVTESNGGTQDRVLRIQYDHRNLPVNLHITDDNLDQYVYYRYNAGGQRIYKKVGSQSAEHYIMDGEQNAAVFDEDGELRYWNILAGGVVGRLDSSGVRFYYIKDHLGSTRAVLNSSGMVVETHDYYPFGLQMPGRDYQTAERTKELFTGKERDTETNWDYFGARYYSAAIGRWFVADPLSELAPQKTPYHYASNNPINRIDPNGMWDVDTVFVTAKRESNYAGVGLMVLGVVGMQGSEAWPIDQIIGAVVFTTGVTIFVLDKLTSESNEEGEGSAIDWDNPPKSPEELGAEWEEVSHPEAKARGHRRFKNNKTGETIRFDKGDPGQSGWKGKDHWHRENPNSSGKMDRYLDKNRNPVPEGSGPSHIQAG